VARLASPCRMSTTRYGLTLIELLVVIGIIGVLAALLFPAIQSVRESARRTNCISNMRQVAQALQNYHDTMGGFPASHNLALNRSYEKERPPDRVADFWSWTMRIAPHLEMKTLYDQADFSRRPWWQKLPGGDDLVGERCEIYTCPSDTRASREATYAGHRVAVTSYLGVSGKSQFVEAGGQDGILYVNSSIRMADITDGTSSTLLIGERPPSENLVFGWQWAGSGESPHFGAADVVLGVHERKREPSAEPDFFRPGTGEDKNGHRYHFWSSHPGGANWALADGSVRFFSYEIGTPEDSGPSVLANLASRAGGEIQELPD